MKPRGQPQGCRGQVYVLCDKAGVDKVVGSLDFRIIQPRFLKPCILKPVDIDHIDQAHGSVRTEASLPAPIARARLSPAATGVST